jgi:hypothetical protein
MEKTLAGGLVGETSGDALRVVKDDTWDLQTHDEKGRQRDAQWLIENR